jgi:hypothetical protein
MSRAGCDYAIGVAMALVFVLGGCGNSNSARTSESQATAQNQGSDQNLSAGPPPPGRPVRGFCGHATVVLGNNPRLLRVTASCRGTKVHSRVAFILARYPLMDPTGQPVHQPVHVRRITATGPGVGASRAQCRPYREGLACGASTHGAVRLHAVLSVPEKSGCRMSVSVITQFDDTCQHQACAGALTAYSLFSARPRGC